MSTPPNPPTPPTGPPTEPAGTPIPEAAPAPEPLPQPAPPEPPLSQDKPLPPAGPTPENPSPPDSPSPDSPSLDKPSPDSPSLDKPSPDSPSLDKPSPDSPSLEKPLPSDKPSPSDEPSSGKPLSLDKPEAPGQTPAPTPPPAPEQTAFPEQPSAPATAPAAEQPEQPGPPVQPAPAPAPNPFAPPSPAAPAPAAHPAAGGGFGPGGPGHPGGPGGPTHPWAQPAPGYGGAPYLGYPQGLPTTNGLAVAALVVGIVGILVALVPFFFWAGAILAATALGLGIGALVRASKGAPRKAMAVTGTVLGVVGLGAAVGGVFLSALVVEKAADRAERRIDWDDPGLDPYPYPGSSSSPTPKFSPSPSPSPTQVPGLTSALPFGETFTYDNGVKVSLSAPKKYQPKGIIAREQVKNAIQITVTITNGSTKPHEVIYAVPNVRDDKGMTAELVFDSGGSGGGVPKMVRGSILPGESASGVIAYEVPEGTASISADISAGTLLDDVKYTGPVT
ncbi:hypothetical protein ACFWP3_28120 [Streptomyces sp. NPDC058525]|uniref:DUF4190 domain-containing protein n=1 Tax=unclassified Streptomyces TaxID=2593676 RepID=UPI0036544E96